MKKYLSLLLICISLLAFSNLAEARRISLHSDEDIKGRRLLDNVTYVVKGDIDLSGQEITIPENTKLVFTKKGKLSNGSFLCHRGVSVKKGAFYNVLFTIDSDFKITGSSFENPDVPITIYKPYVSNGNLSSVSITNCKFSNIGRNTHNRTSTIAAVYLQQVKDTYVTDNVFSGIGNITSKNVSAILVGTATATTRDKSAQPNLGIRILNNSFESLFSLESVKVETGETHFIFVEGANRVQIEGNKMIRLEDGNHGADNEFIYTKCDSVSIIKNYLEGICGGEGFICCKPYGIKNESYLTHCDIIGNTIIGESFSAITHYGVGSIVDNRIENGYTGFILAIKKTLKDNVPENRQESNNDRIFVSHNTIVSKCTLGNEDILLTSTQRSAVHIDCASPSMCNTDVFFQDNQVTVEGSYFSGFFNLRDFRYGCFYITGNTFNYEGTVSKSLVYLQSVNSAITHRRLAKVAIQSNRIKGFDKCVSIAGGGFSSSDELDVVFEGNEVELTPVSKESGCIIDARIKPEGSVRFIGNSVSSSSGKKIIKVKSAVKDQKISDTL